MAFKDTEKNNEAAEEGRGAQVMEKPGRLIRGGHQA